MTHAPNNPVALPQFLAPHATGFAVFPSRAMDLRDATRLLRRRARLIAGIAATCAVIALLAALTLKPIYRAESVVLLEPRQTDIVDMRTVISSLTVGNEALHSEMDIIQSRAVIDRVIARLHLQHDREFNPRSGFWGHLNPAQWMTADRKQREQTLVAENIAKRLKVENDGRSYSIHILFASQDPQKAAAIDNAFAEEYLIDQLDAKYDATARANAWLNERLAALKAKVETAERAVEDFRQTARLVDVEEGRTVAGQQLQDINTQLSDARGATSQAEARLRAAQTALDSKDGINGVADVSSSPLIENLREQEAEARRNAAELATKYGALHPKIIAAQAQLRSLQAKIAEEAHKIFLGLSNEVAIARARETTLENEVKQLEDRAGVESKDSVTLRQLQREAEANRMLYESFLNRFKQTAAQKDLHIPDARVISRAEIPAKPAFPNKLLFMLIGAIGGGILGVVIAYLIEYFDRGFRSTAQVEAATGLPVIGLVPDLRQVTYRAPEDYVTDKPLSAFGEALRSVRMAMQFSNSDRPPKVVMITSASPGEGKTTFCVTLARTLAKTGNKILLIDADLRRSRIAATLGLTQLNGGLPALLAGKQSFAQTILTDRVVPDLDIIAAVGKVPNAQDLLGSPYLREMVSEAAGRYHLVIIDTPPLLAVADATAVARIADASIVLVRWAQVSQDLVLQALKKLQAPDCRLAGIVLSQVNLTEHAKYTDSYHHQHYSQYYTN